MVLLLLACYPMIVLQEKGFRKGERHVVLLYTT